MVITNMTANISQKGLDNLAKMAKWRDTSTGGGNFVTIKDGETKTLEFDIEDMEQEEVEFEGKTTTRGKYGVWDFDDPSAGKRYFYGGKRVSWDVDSNLGLGNYILRITRKGMKFDTKYSVVSVPMPKGTKLPSGKISE